MLQRLSNRRVIRILTQTRNFGQRMDKDYKKDFKENEQKEEKKSDKKEKSRMF